jgi:hypothetical protein
MSKHPNNGPTFSKPTIKMPRRDPLSPDKQKAAAEQAARDAAKERTFRKRLMEDPKALFEEAFGCSIAEYLKKKNYYR